MMIRIKHRATGKILYTTEAATLREAVERAVADGVNLAYANLASADLAGACLVGAGLARAKLVGAELAGAELAGANLRGANLADACLARANLAGAIGLPAAPVVPDLDVRILAAVEGEQAIGKLDMSRWHTCETTHCRAGWAITLAGEAGKELEDLLGPTAAGALIYHASVGYVPDFYAFTEVALADIRARAKDAT